MYLIGIDGDSDRLPIFLKVIAIESNNQLLLLCAPIQQIVGAQIFCTIQLKGDGVIRIPAESKILRSNSQIKLAAEINPLGKKLRKLLRKRQNQIPTGQKLSVLKGHQIHRPKIHLRQTDKTSDKAIGRSLINFLGTAHLLNSTFLHHDDSRG